MKKLLLSVMLMISSVSFAVAPVLAVPVAGVDSLKQNAVKSFLQKANDPKSALNQRLTKFNQEQADGRNSSGVLPKTLTYTNIQVISIGGENQFGSYCTAIPAKPENTKCTNGVSETFLILIPYKMGVHKAVEYDSMKFIVKVAKSADWKMDEQQKEYDRHESVKVEDPTEVSVQAVSRTVK
ncbi:MAG: hypothetical protein H0X31_06735 [Nostocaceae cyanobacterium]|nr:hypothetical protein [Nostocaceae cyanobacterium]